MKGFAMSLYVESRRFTQAEISRLMAACQTAALPAVSDESPAAWWQRFVSYLLATGDRVGKALAMRTITDAPRFPWPHDRRQLHAEFRRILNAAGIDDGRSFHALRVTYTDLREFAGVGGNGGAL
jgi:hypothetical protein